MKLHHKFAWLLPVLLTGCFYGTVKMNSTDRNYIPYDEVNELIFVNTHNQYDTLRLHKTILQTSNLDHFIDRQFGKTDERKKTAYESYTTERTLKQVQAKVAVNQPYLKYDPVIFTFYKSEQNTEPVLYYTIDRMKGTTPLAGTQLDSLQTVQKLYTDVIVIESSADPLFEISKIYWSMQYGLIQIDEKNGEQWTLKSKTFKNKNP